MAQAGPAPKVKLICGMISSRESLFCQAQALLADRLGPCDIVSEVMDFDFTHYYDQEMGSPLYRRFVSFAGLRDADVLADAKLATNEMEQSFASAGGPQRPINLDPGYIEKSKLVLASMKNFSHRICLGRGVFAEVTMFYRHGTWEPLPWTFPDYASGRYFPFLGQVRASLLGQEESQ